MKSSRASVGTQAISFGEVMDLLEETQAELKKLKATLEKKEFIPENICDDDRKRFIDDLEDDDFPPMTGKTPAKATNSKKKQRKFNLNLAESENDKKYQPYSINLGRGLVMELKEFRNAHYLDFVKFGDGNEVHNRFNIPIDQLTVLKKAIGAIENHIDSH
ncbi:hypothetical protein TNCV_1613891 [Trichonephila clavipes]|nr:hypothetical protein TNCV_1613891 [Trichonephila clavipes]